MRELSLKKVQKLAKQEIKCNSSPERIAFEQSSQSELVVLMGI